MTNFRSCHLIVNRKLAHDRSSRVCDFIDPDFSVGEVLLIYFLNGLHPQTLTFSFAITLILGKR